MKPQEKVEELFKKLKSAKDQIFPKKGETLEVPTEQGVYIIYGSKGKVLHVGRTLSGKNGIKQRLENHMSSGQSSFTRNYLDGGKGEWLRGRCKFRYIVVRDDRIRAYLEAYAIGSLCPEHIGVG